MCSETLKNHFKEREIKVLELIKEAGFFYEEIGVFGSYARGEYKSTSDIDFCIIVEQKPSRRISGPLREEAELLGADIVFVTREYFETDTSLFAQNLRRDYRKYEE